jgi:hypothetical protein
MWIFVLRSLWLGALMMGIFGVARGLSLTLIAANAGGRLPCHQTMRMVNLGQPLVRAVTALVLAASGAWLIGALGV